MAKQLDSDVQKVNDFLAECQQTHTKFEKDVDAYYDVYRGYLDPQSEAADYTTKMHPPYLNQVVETITNSLVDPGFSYSVKPRPKAVNPQQWEALVEASKTLERMLAYELYMDKFNEKQRPFILQGVIAPLTVGKTYWRSQKGKRSRLAMGNQDYYSKSSGEYVGSAKGLVEQQYEGYLVDGPCFEVVDVRDFFWPESATSLDGASAVVHRMYKTYDELLALQEAGVYQNVEQLQGQEGNTAGAPAGREQTYNQANRFRDKIPVYEYWTNGSVIVKGGEEVLLAPEQPNPYWHGQKPFVVASALPDLFQIPGISMIELVQHLQKMLWTLINQRIDGLRLLANPVLLARSDLDDIEQIRFEPGRVIEVENPDQIKILEIPPQIPSLTIEAEQMIKGELQNLTGGALFMSGANSAPIDQTTATGVSIVSSLAQKQMQARQQNFKAAFARVGHHFVSMLQQFPRGPRAYAIVGQDADMELLQGDPLKVQGEFDVQIEASTDSSVRQERRAEAQALVQVAAQIAPVMAMAGQPLNMKAFVERFLDAYDVIDKDAFFSSQPPPGLAPPGGAPGQPGQPPVGPPGPGGITAPQASAPTSPSSQASVSPEVMLQRALAMRGGVANGGGQ